MLNPEATLTCTCLGMLCPHTAGKMLQLLCQDKQQAALKALLCRRALQVHQLLRTLAPSAEILTLMVRLQASGSHMRKLAPCLFESRSIQLH